MMVLDFMEPLERFFKYIKEIDMYMERVHPKDVSSSYLSFVSAESRYENLNEEIQRGLMLPNWDMLNRPKSYLRPLIFLLLMEGLDKEPQNFVKYSAILEMIHNGTLIHDDIEDNAIFRRGDAPIHKKYGVDVAVNSANLLYFAPFLFFKLFRDDFSKETILKAYECLIEHLNRVTWGQAIDIEWHNSSKIPKVNEYLQMCCYKTGAIDRMTFSLAGVLAEEDQMKKRELENFGETLGICLQMHDDFLDTCSINRKDIGEKAVGNDIYEGKKSIVNILALKMSEEGKERLLEILTKKQKSEKEINEALEIIGNSGALQKTLTLVKEKFGELRGRCSKILSKKSSDTLIKLIDNLECDLLKKYGDTKWVK